MHATDATNKAREGKAIMPENCARTHCMRASRHAIPRCNQLSPLFSHAEARHTYIPFDCAISYQSNHKNAKVKRLNSINNNILKRNAQSKQHH